MKLKTLTVAATLALVVAAALIGSASSTGAAPKPGFLPGIWNGKGTIGGSVTDEVGTTLFKGTFKFRIKVAPDFTVTGTGRRVLRMKGTGDPSSTMRGIGTLKFSGTASDVRFTGTEQVVGNITVNGYTHPLRMTKSIPTEEGASAPLVIKRPGKCRALGTVPMGPGVTLKWTAELAIRGTCNA